LHVCGDASDAAGALPAINELAPDLVIIDLKLKGTSGLDLTRQVTSYHTELPVVVHSMYDEKMYAARAFGAGARGYVMKNGPQQKLVDAARDVLLGRLAFSEAVMQQIHQNEPPADADEPALHESFTDRELEVFMLLGQGYAPRHIAEELHLSVSTIEVYRQRLKKKLGLGSAALLQRFAVRWCRDNKVG
jgi:DNA-binding NarL/FixJ family response regulator